MKTKMSSREQLELAAIAARLKYIKPTDDYDGSQGLMLCNEHGFPTRNWNPLADNGDAFELMVRMRLRLDFTGASFDVIAAKPTLHRLLGTDLATSRSVNLPRGSV